MTNAPTHFKIIEDFDHNSARAGKCYFTGAGKRRADPKSPQQQPHEVDEFILRGPAIAFEGFLDIRPCVITDTAREVFGMLTEAEAREIEYAAELNAELAAQEATRADVAEGRLSDMILANAEMIVQMQALQDELTQAYEDLYATDDDLALVGADDDADDA